MRLLKIRLKCGNDDIRAVIDGECAEACGNENAFALGNAHRAACMGDLRIAAEAKKSGVVVVEVDRRKLDSMSTTHSHQGVIAVAAVREYATVEQIYFPSIRLPWASFKSFFSEVPVLAAIL